MTAPVDSNIIAALIGAFSALVVLCIKEVWDWWLEHSKEKKRIRFLARKLKFFFESLASTMYTKIFDNETESEEESSPIQSAFDMLPLPESDDYSLLNDELLDKIGEFPNKMLAASQYISSLLYSPLGFDDILEEQILRMLLRMQEALMIAEDLRITYKLPPNLKEQCSLLEAVEKRLKEIKDQTTQE